MSDYLLSVVGIVFLSSMINAIIPEGKTSGMVKSVVKLLCILVILTPFAKIMQNDGLSLEDYFSKSVIKIDENFIEYCSEKTILTAQTQMEKEILDEFETQTSVRLEWVYDAADKENSAMQNRIKITCIYIEAPIENQSQIQEYLVQRYGCKVVMEAWT